MKRGLQLVQRGSDLDDISGNRFLFSLAEDEADKSDHGLSLSRTPGPFPLASMKSTPAVSRAVRMAVRLLAIGVRLPDSKLAIVAVDTFEDSDSCPCDQPISPLAALH